MIPYRWDPPSYPNSTNRETLPVLHTTEFMASI